MKTLRWTFVAMLLTTPAALAHGGHDVDVRLDAAADMTVVARADAASRASYAWDWGDGQASAGARARHAYHAPGVYRVILSWTDDAGDTHERAREVRVAAPESKLRVDVDHGDTARGRVEVDSRTRVTWAWGDGETSHGRRVRHHYDAPGTYDIVVTYDREGACWEERRTIVIAAPEDAQDEDDEHGEAPRRERRASGEARVGVAGLSARVSVGAGGEGAAEDEPGSSARSDSRVRVSSSERRDAPGAGAPLALVAVGAVALFGRKFMKK